MVVRAGHPPETHRHRPAAGLTCRPGARHPGRMPPRVEATSPAASGPAAETAASGPVAAGRAAAASGLVMSDPVAAAPVAPAVPRTRRLRAASGGPPRAPHPVAPVTVPPPASGDPAGPGPPLVETWEGAWRRVEVPDSPSVAHPDRPGPPAGRWRCGRPWRCAGRPANQGRPHRLPGDRSCGPSDGSWSRPPPAHRHGVGSRLRPALAAAVSPDRIHRASLPRGGPTPRTTRRSRASRSAISRSAPRMVGQ